MKRIFYFFLAAILFFSCGNPNSNEKPESNQEVEKTQTSSKKSTMPDDDRVSGSFEITVDGKAYKSTQLQDNYCDMTYNFKGEKSFVVARFKDVHSDDALLVAIYGDESFISNPDEKIEQFMFSKGQNKANIQFLPGDGKGAMTSYTMVEGSFTLSKFEEGQIIGSFAGSGGLPKDVVTKENLIPFTGEINLKTENVTKMGNTEGK